MTTLAERAYELLRQVPQGRVTTYKHLAQALNTRAYRAIGQVMKRNPYAPVVPCHRVVSSSGKIGGFMGKKQGEEIDKKITLLREEGVEIRNGKVWKFEEVVFRFDLGQA